MLVTIGLPVDLNSSKAFVINSLAQTLPPGLFTLRTKAFTESSLMAFLIFFTIVSDPATPYCASPVVIAPSTLTTAILFSESLMSSSNIDKYS